MTSLHRRTASLTHFLVVADQDRSRDFYPRLFDGQVVVERDPVIIRVANSWLILNEGGGPTDDKPTVTLTTPPIPTAPAPSSTSGSPTSTGPTRSGRQGAQSFSPSQRTTDARSALTPATPTVTSSRSARRPAPSPDGDAPVMEFDDLPHHQHAHEFVGADHGEDPFSVILVHAAPDAGPRLHRHPYPELFVVESGQARFQLARTRWWFAGGDRGRTGQCSSWLY
jgi:mannose-6-phosphate isomerase-like protein (cupin superfamily)